MNILITRAGSFIGRALCNSLSSSDKVVGIDITGPPDGALNIAWERADPPASPVRLSLIGWRAGLSESDGGQA